MTLLRQEVGPDDLDIRWAQKHEAGEIARLFLISSDGLAAYIWSQMDMPGLSLEEIGAVRYAREDTAFSYEKCLVAERSSRIVGMVHSFPMEADPVARPEDDPVLRPYAELEDVGSLYVSGLAVYPDHRNAGIGTELMECVHERARAKGLPRVSLICFERNEPAMRLYDRLGYGEKDRRPIVPHPTLHYADGDAILLVREV